MSTRLPGFRFYPTEEELLQFYLRNKLDKRRPEMERIIPVVDVYNHDPAELPQMSGEESVQDPEQWFFFCPRQEKEAQGGRPTRSTRSGYWKATGSPTQVIHNNRVIGIRKTMVFYEGRAPHGRKTSWKMNEYKAYKESCTSDEALKLRSEFNLCRVYKRSGCLRSFDRRPTVATVGTSATADDVDRSVSTAGTSSYQGDPTMAMETQLSPGSSMSTDPYVPGEGIEGELALEELDWNFLFGYDESLA